MSVARSIDFNELAKGKARPICIWNEGQARAYYEATEEQRAAWNRYAQAEADIFNNNPRLDSYDSTATHTGYDKEAGCVTPWAPPLTFREFLANNFSVPSSSTKALETDAVALLREARQWFGDGENADDPGREVWTDNYRDIVDRVDAFLLRSSSPVGQTAKEGE